MPVYPSEGYISQQQKDGMTQTGNGDHVQFHSLTKREYFAGMAMQGLLSNNAMIDTINWNWVSENSVKLADELLKALEDGK